MPNERNQRRRRQNRARRNDTPPENSQQQGGLESYKTPPTENHELESVAAHFAYLTNAILKRLQDNTDGSEQLLNKWKNTTHQSFIHELRGLYNRLYAFHNDPTQVMPNELVHKEVTLYTPKYDARLHPRVDELVMWTKSFMEELGFLVTRSRNVSSCCFISVTLRIDSFCAKMDEKAKKLATLTN